MESVEETAGLHEGDVLVGKYRIERVLGVGGMGVVVAARHLQLETKVAIKFLLPAMLSNSEIVGRFAREARAAVRITGEHVARVLDVGTLETGAPFMVMEFLEGGDLAAWLQQRGALPIDQALEFVLQACIAVAEAHALGIVHRDLKPANLFCIRRADGKTSIKVLDFGISKLTDSGSDREVSVTKSSAMMGSPLYMSPEQMRSSKDVDTRTDVWALGVILYELLAGRTPFHGETVTDVAIKVATVLPDPMRVFRVDVPPGLEAVILKALEKNKDARYQNVAELALALRAFLPARSKVLVDRICGILRVPFPGSLAPEAMPPPPAPSEPLAMAATLTALSSTARGTTGGRKRIAAFVALGTAAALGVAAFAVVAGSHGPAASSRRGAVSSGAALSLPTEVLVPPPAPVQLVDPAAPTEIVAKATNALPGPVSEPAAPPPKGPAARPAQPRATSARLAPAQPPAAAASASAATPRPSPPAQHKNQLDLGNFQ